MKTTNIATVLALFCVATLSACKKEPQFVTPSYSVVSYDSATGHWIIVSAGTTWKGKQLRKRLSVVCDFYQWGDRQMVEGPNACDLHVGETIIVHHEPDAQGTYAGFVDVWEMSPDRLAVVHGDGPDKVSQQFIILKNEVLP